MAEIADFGNGLKGYTDIAELPEFNSSSINNDYAYTTFRNEKYNIAGNVRHEIRLTMDLENAQNNTAECKELETVDAVNMYYGFAVNQNSLSPDLYSGAPILKYTNISEHELEIYNSGNGNVPYQDYNNPAVNDFLPTKSDGYSYAFNRYGVLTEIDKTAIHTLIEMAVFQYDEENNALLGVGISSAIYDALIEWLENDTSGILLIDGKKHIVTISNIYTLPISSTNINQVLKYNSKNITIFPLCERYADNLYYFRTPYYSKSPIFSKIPYYWTKKTFGNYTFPTATQLYGDNATNGSVTSIKNSCYCSITKSIEQNQDFNIMHTFVDNAYEFLYNTNEIDYVSPTLRWVLRDDNILQMYGRTLRSTIDYSMSIHTYKPVSGREYMATFGATLFPFLIVSNSAVIRTGIEYIGKREEDGSYIGNFERYTSPEQIENDFRPDDFIPVNPEEEFNKSQPETPDTGTEREGDSQVITAPVNLIGCAGFLTNYVMTSVNMQNFGASLWASFNDSVFWQSLGAVLSDSLSINPSDILKYIVSLRCYPINLWELERTQVDKLYVGRGTAGIDIGVGLSYTNEMTMFKSCGSITVPERYGNYLDYSPYTEISIYLPFCGEFELNATEISGSTLTVHYAIDFTTGLCTAWVLSGYGGVEYIVLSASGQIGQDIQITAGNISQVAISLVSATAGAISGSLKPILDNISEEDNSTGSAVTGAVQGFRQNFKSGLFPSTVLANPSFTSFYAPMTPFLKIKSSRIVKPNNWGSTSGNVAQRAVSLGSMAGFVQCVNPDVSGIPASEQGLQEIRQMLEHGIYV